MSLPEGLNLIVGSQYADLPWYYQNVKAALLADVNGFLLVISFPLTAVNRNYEIYKVIAFPFKIANNTYLRYNLDSGYLAINILHQTYLAMRENIFEQCQGQSVKICPANEAVTVTKAKSYALSLFLQNQDVKETCQRIVTVQQPSPVLRRLGGLVIYFSPSLQRSRQPNCVVLTWEHGRRPIWFYKDLEFWKERSRARFRWETCNCMQRYGAVPSLMHQ